MARQLFLLLRSLSVVAQLLLADDNSTASTPLESTPMLSELSDYHATALGSTTLVEVTNPLLPSTCTSPRSLDTRLCAFGSATRLSYRHRLVVSDGDATPRRSITVRLVAYCLVCNNATAHSQIDLYRAARRAVELLADVSLCKDLRGGALVQLQVLVGNASATDWHRDWLLDRHLREARGNGSLAIEMMFAMRNGTLLGECV